MSEKKKVDLLHEVDHIASLVDVAEKYIIGHSELHHPQINALHTILICIQDAIGNVKKEYQQQHPPETED